MSTTPDTTVPEWLHEGATVAQYTGGRGLAVQANAMEATVTRLTRTQARVSYNGQEWVYRRHDTLGAGPVWERRIGGAWGDTWTLLPVDDPKVLAVYERQRLSAAASKVEDLALRWRRDRDLQAARKIADVLVEAGVIASYEPAPQPEAADR